jgi:hypothetical protein
LAAALFFKNFIRRSWTDEDGNYKLPQDEVTAIKREVIGLMISVPATIQTQLGEAISVIADSDFWERWDTLVDDLVSRFTPDNPKVNNGVLQVAHSIFRRWRPLFRTDDLFTEINHVLSKFCEPYLALLQVRSLHRPIPCTTTDILCRAPISKSPQTKTTRTSSPSTSPRSTSASSCSMIFPAKICLRSSKTTSPPSVLCL